MKRLDLLERGIPIEAFSVKQYHDFITMSILGKATDLTQQLAESIWS